MIYSSHSDYVRLRRTLPLLGSQFADFSMSQSCVCIVVNKGLRSGGSSLPCKLKSLAYLHLDSR